MVFFFNGIIFIIFYLFIFLFSFFNIQFCLPSYLIFLIFKTTIHLFYFFEKSCPDYTENQNTKWPS